MEEKYLLDELDKIEKSLALASLYNLHQTFEFAKTRKIKIEAELDELRNRGSRKKLSAIVGNHRLRKRK